MSELNEILILLDEEAISEVIETPVDNVLNKYSFSVSENFSQKEFFAIIAGYLKLLKNQGILILINGNEFSTIFSFLEKHYYGEGSQGYERALLDITKYGKDGITMILKNSSESLKIELRRQYLEWIYSTRVIYLDWASKLELVKELSNQNGFTHRSDISYMSDEQNALFLKEIFTENLKTVQSIKSILQTKSSNI